MAYENCNKASILITRANKSRLKIEGKKQGVIPLQAV